MGNIVSQCPVHSSWSFQSCFKPACDEASRFNPLDFFFHIGIPMLLSAALANQIRKKEEMQTNYTHKMGRLQQEVDELRQRGDKVDDSQSASSSSPPSELRHYIARLERREDRHLKDQLKLVKDFGRRLERIEDIGCSYFKPRAARCRMQDELFRQVEKGQLQGIVKRDHLSTILECDPMFCGLTAEDNGRLRQIYAKHWQTKLKLNKYRNIVCKLKQLEDETLPPQN